MKATGGLILVIVAVVLVLGSCTFKSVPAGHVAVATLFGSIRPKPYSEGMHFPVNPLYQWTLYDCRQKTHKETASVPSRDQQTTEVDISVQYRIVGSAAAKMLNETGTAEQAIEVHLIPQVRSLVREQGKTIQRAEDFFTEETQQRLQTTLTASLSAQLLPNGIEVSDVLIRDIRLPDVILRQVEQKKVKEQEAEREKAELERRKIEAQQQVVMANAQREAAEQEAIKKKTLADAQAYEIQKINEAIAQNPAYIQLQALKSLEAIAKDPAAKMYFMNSDSPMPLPLMHMGEPVGGAGPRR